MRLKPKRTTNLSNQGENKTIIRWVIGLSIVFFLATIVLILSKVKILGINIGTVLLTLELCYTALSYGTVKIDEVGAMFFFERPMKNLKKGPYIAFLGILSVRKEKGTFFQDELPAEPEKIYRGDKETPEGMFPPIRVKFGMPDNDKRLKDDPYNVSMVADVVPVVAWRISNLIIFLEKMGTVENCKKILSDKAIEIFGDDLSTKTPAKALLKLKKISQKLQKKLEDSVATKDPITSEEKQNWGIEIKDAYLKPFNFSHALNDAVVEVVKEGQKAKATIIRAAAEKQKLIDEGIGAADAKERMLNAEAKGQALIKKLILEAEAIGVEKLIEASKGPDGQAILWMKTLQTAFEKSQYSIVPGSELFTAASGIKEMIEKATRGTK